MKTLSKNKLTALVAGAILTLSCAGCKDYLTVQPIDRLTGNNYYLSQDDVESNLAFIYSKFFEKINETWVMGSIGEARSGEIFVAEGANNRSQRLVIEALGKNDLLTAINSTQFDWYDLSKITDWKKYYEVIQSVNILIEKLHDGIPGVDGQLKDAYLAEATFIRCFTYFWMARLYGDVPYYTESYHTEALGREDMVTVLNNCIQELQPMKDLIPWSYNDPAMRGARPAKGAVIALLMHINMWNTNFDSSNKPHYLDQAIALGKELIDSKQHQLVAPFNDQNWATVTKGRSEESLFEFYKSINYGDDVAALAPFWDHFLRWPYKFPRFTNQISHCYFSSIYMNQIFPEGIADQRRQLWFEDITSDNGQFVLRKFGTNVYASGNEDKNPDNTFSIFRYADAILLYAEACAEAGGKDPEAIAAVNMVRSRAQATPYTGGGGADLKNFIYLERCRELIGEGHRYFDLIRTRRILSSEWTLNPLTLDQFNRGAWTWPIHSSALQNNPNMQLNQYWTSIGR